MTENTAPKRPPLTAREIELIKDPGLLQLAKPQGMTDEEWAKQEARIKKHLLFFARYHAEQVN